ncbi:Acb2/Tad1 domain-containing protein [Magnetovibrio blakemorei]|uniref:Uncharacterized protein n=1 Tax=Magnetovibrio blakemorei TaxID=28181 RepID=A0A1E5Q4K5_9PROT|nr:hypothetical protein [Magnetovibrio blakemorei]OEJ64661.1 hypothetical protein BEN30_00790 [Magnetovibrio blakemorei]
MTRQEEKYNTAKHYAKCIALLVSEIGAERAEQCKSAEANDVHRSVSEAMARLDEAMMWAGRIVK